MIQVQVYELFSDACQASAQVFCRTQLGTPLGLILSFLLSFECFAIGWVHPCGAFCEIFPSGSPCCFFFLHRVGILVSPWPAKNIIHYFTSMHSLYLSSDFSYFFSIQFSHVSSKYAQYFLQLINMLLLLYGKHLFWWMAWWTKISYQILDSIPV